MSELALQETRLSLADLSKIKEIFSKLGIVLRPIEGGSGDELIYFNEEDTSNNEPVKCEGCEKELKLSEFGHLVHGSKLFYCKSPYCFNHFLATKKVR